MPPITSTSAARLPRAAREIAQTLTEAVTAARHQDAEGLEAAAARLAAQDAEQVRVLFGALVRRVLEERHPDGVNGDDLRDLLDRVVRWALPWWDALDVTVMIVVLTGALGVHEPEPDDPDDWNQRTPPPAVEAVVAHASLLVTDLVPGPRNPEDGETEVRARVDAVLAELAQTQLQEMP